MTVNVHYLDEGWVKRSRLLKFIRFKIVHCRKASFSVLLDLISKWLFESEIQIVITGSAADILKAVGLLRRHLYVSTRHPQEHFYVWCIAHVLSLAVKYCMKLVHEKLDKIHKQPDSIKSSIKRETFLLF